MKLLQLWLQSIIQPSLCIRNGSTLNALAGARALEVLIRCDSFQVGQ
jgi:hypothetical protein